MATAQVEALFIEIADLFVTSNVMDAVNLATRLNRVDDLMTKVGEISNQAYRQISRDVHDAISLVGIDQGKVAADLLASELSAAGLTNIVVNPAPVNKAFYNAILKADPLQGTVMGESFKNQSAAAIRRVKQQLQLGLTQNETTDQMVRRIRGRSTGKRGKFTGGVMRTSTREAQALVRTATTHISVVGQLETYKANKDIVEKYQYVATFDAKTTPICASLDGRQFRVDDAFAPRPEQHWNCRSTTVPVINWKKLGVKAPPVGTRASISGQVSAKFNYERWLRTQNQDFRIEVLGKNRARLFTQRKVTLRDLVRDDGTLIPLIELNV